ncbi:MAG TPA: sigma 54-interacting transcriptional regulator [Planctomycetota bacterium]|nr:sigma 54-interacting transcriptional regulator [Planctomycetota bacterium]
MLETLPEELLGTSTEASRLRRFIEDASAEPGPVIFTGEPGTGKHVIARMLHEHSPRQEAPYLMVDCSLFYERELKRELFGYVAPGGKGKSRKGLFEFASDGTCYLARIEELSSGIQEVLLEFLRTGRFARLGDGKPISSSVRILASSSKNLAGFVNAGLFDDDLYRRLSAWSLRLAPLRERREDIPAIVDALTHAHTRDRPAVHSPIWSADALQALKAYPWPGNMDELSREVRRLVESGVPSVLPEHLAVEVASSWLGQRGDPEIRRVLDELDGYIREFRILSRLDLSYGDLLDAASNQWKGSFPSRREPPSEE